MTYQRSKVLERLKDLKTHPTADIIYGAVKKDIPNITLATVYRNLNLLAEKGKILRLEINGEYHYDGDMCCHQHCVCRKCGKIIDVFQKEISNYAMKKIKSNKFDAECVNIIFSGICKRCSKGGDKNAKKR